MRLELIIIKLLMYLVLQTIKIKYLAYECNSHYPNAEDMTIVDASRPQESSTIGLGNFFVLF